MIRPGRAEDLRAAGEILSTYVRVQRTLRGGDVRTVLRELRDRPLGEATPAQGDAADVARLAGETARVLGRVPRDSRCLKQSLVLSALLARRGISSQVVIAVGDRSGRFGAHAWVEAEGRAWLEPSAPGDKRLVTL